MTKSISSDVPDGAHNVFNDATLMVVCSAAPTTRTEAVTTYALADVAVSSGDFTIAANEGGGRKCTVAAKSNVPVDASGTPTHVALVDATRLIAVTECSGPGLTVGSTVNFPAFAFRLPNPT